MAKEIKITLYTPKELWAKFCNWVFWPRKKKCAEWLDALQGNIEHKIVNEILSYKHKTGQMSFELANDLEIEIKAIIQKEVDKIKSVICKPY